MLKNTIFWTMVLLIFAIAKLSEYEEAAHTTWFAVAALAVGLIGWIITEAIEMRRDRKKSGKLKPTFKIVK